MSRKKRNSRRYRRMRRRKIVFAVEIVVLILLAGVLFAYAWLNKSMDRMDQTTLNRSDIAINSEVNTKSNLEAMSGTQTIALVGMDTRAKGTEGDDNFNSDTMIICCIDHDRSEVRMVSVMRDTWMNLAKSRTEDYRFKKANAAYNLGGPEMMLSMMNTNLDLAITDYVTVNFKALADAIDVLGGLDVEMQNYECVHTNSYNHDVSVAQGVEYVPVEYDESLGDHHSEMHHLTGSQAVAYARIRYGGGDDSKRTSRQRIIINLMVEKIKKNPEKIPAIMDQVMGNVSTSLSKSEILKLGMNAVTYSMATSYAYPFELCYGQHVIDALGTDVVIPVTMETNVRELHEYLYPDMPYTVSPTVQEYSDYIADNSGYGPEKIESVLHQGPGSESETQVSGN